MPSFETLVSSLTAEHDRQVDALELQIQILREQLKQARPSYVAPEVTKTVTIASNGDSEGPAPADAQSKNVRLSESLQSETGQLRGSKVEQLTNLFLQRNTSERGQRPSKVTQSLFPAMTLKDMHIHAQEEKKPMGAPLQNLRNLLENPHFELLVMSVVVANSLVMCFEAQYQGLDFAYSLEIQGYNNPAKEFWPGAAQVLDVLEKVFVGMFTAELLLRLVALRLQFFTSAFHWLDFVVVIAGLIDWAGGSKYDPTMMRMIRITRIARMLRLKELKCRGFVDALYFLTTSIRKSFSVLFWSLVVLTIIQCISALVMCQMLSSWFEDATASEESTKVFLYYGTFTRSIFTMFEILLGNWPIPSRVLTENVGEEYGTLVLVYKCICGFAVVNIISAVFLQQTMKTMSQDTDIMLLERGRTEKQFKDHLVRLFDLLDMSDEGFVTKKQMETRLEDPDVRKTCFNLGLSVYDIEDMFNLFNMNAEGMRIHEFIQAAHSVRKQANTLDIARLLMHSRHLSATMQVLQGQVTKALKRLDALHQDLPSFHL